MQKIIAFSLWGDDPKYCIGAVRNAQLASKFFPEWECWFYYDKKVPRAYIDVLKDFNNVKVILVEHQSFGAFWRFFDMREGAIVLSRDCDSRLSEREKHIVDDWLKSGEKMCVIRDHINHYEFPILAGMWGIKDGLPEDTLNSMKRYWSSHTYTIDQLYLRDVVWPELKTNCKEYGIKETLWMRESYPHIGRHFIGQTYNEYEYPIYEAALK
jgi:hypothetical protein